MMVRMFSLFLLLAGLVVNLADAGSFETAVTIEGGLLEHACANPHLTEACETLDVQVDGSGNVVMSYKRVSGAEATVITFSPGCAPLFAKLKDVIIGASGLKDLVATVYGTPDLLAEIASDSCNFMSMDVPHNLFNMRSQCNNGGQCIKVVANSNGDSTLEISDFEIDFTLAGADAPVVKVFWDDQKVMFNALTGVLGETDVNTRVEINPDSTLILESHPGLKEKILSWEYKLEKIMVAAMGYLDHKKSVRAHSFINGISREAPTNDYAGWSATKTRRGEPTFSERMAGWPYTRNAWNTMKIVPDSSGNLVVSYKPNSVAQVESKSVFKSGCVNMFKELSKLASEVSTFKEIVDSVYSKPDLLADIAGGKCCLLGMDYPHPLYRMVAQYQGDTCGNSSITANTNGETKLKIAGLMFNFMLAGSDSSAVEIDYDNVEMSFNMLTGVFLGPSTDVTRVKVNADSSTRVWRDHSEVREAILSWEGRIKRYIDALLRYVHGKSVTTASNLSKPTSWFSMAA